jgi:hypothetical protein
MAGTKELVEALSPPGRATVAFLATVRLAAIMADDRLDTYFPGGRAVFESALATGEALARGATPGADLATLPAAFDAVLGPMDEEREEPPLEGTWFNDALSVADYMVRAWVEPARSADWCVDALGEVESSVDFLERELGGRDGPLTGAERDRQRADLAAVAAATADPGRLVDTLLLPSRDLGLRYAEVHRRVTAR